MITLFLSLAMAGDTQAMTSDQQSVDDNKRVCRSDSTLGTKIPKRTCRTKKEWAQIDGANAEASSESLRSQQSYSRGTQSSN
jgi:hypothetical protein